MYVDEKKEDLSGVGDDLDVLLDVLPGKDAAAELQAQDFADEIMLKVCSLHVLVCVFPAPGVLFCLWQSLAIAGNSIQCS